MDSAKTASMLRGLTMGTLRSVSRTAASIVDDSADGGRRAARRSSSPGRWRCGPGRRLVDEQVELRARLLINSALLDVVASHAGPEPRNLIAAAGPEPLTDWIAVLQNVLTSVSLTTATMPAAAASVAWNPRPCMMGIPIV
jgi:hypothetical protein